MPPQAGVTVGHDLTLIRDSYDVEGAGMVDLGQLATKHLGIAVGSRSLGSLSTTLLRRRLSKANSVRMDNWEKELTPEQVCTATVPPQGNSVYFSFAAFWAVADRRYEVCCVCTWYNITRTVAGIREGLPAIKYCHMRVLVRLVNQTRSMDRCLCIFLHQVQPS